MDTSFDIRKVFSGGKFRVSIALQSPDIEYQQRITQAVGDLFGLKSWRLFQGEMVDGIEIDYMLSEPRIMLSGSDKEVMEIMEGRIVQSFMEMIAWYAGTGTLQVTAIEFHPFMPLGTVIVPVAPK